MSGEIVHIVEERGFCFIRPDGGGRADDLFGHASQFAIQGEFGSHNLGRGVSYDIDRTPESRGKIRAVNIRVVS